MKRSQIHAKKAIRIFTIKRKFWWAKDESLLPKLTKAFFKYKVFVPYAWGVERKEQVSWWTICKYFSFGPRDACSETYLETGCFDHIEEAVKHAKYMMTQFFRGFLFLNKFSRHSTTAFGAIPLQTYEEPWWNETIKQINEHLFDKYCVSEEVREFVKKHI